MTNKDLLEITANQDPPIIAAQLQHFYHQHGGDVIPPFLSKGTEEIDFLEYQLRDDKDQSHPDSTITIRAASNKNHSIVHINLWDASERWGIALDDPIKGKLNGRHLLGNEKSGLCIEFCQRFSTYLHNAGFVVKDLPEANNGKRKSRRRSENQWAIEQLLAGHDKQSVYNKWLERRRQAGRTKGMSSEWELFRQSVWKPYKQILKHSDEK